MYILVWSKLALGKTALDDELTYLKALVKTQFKPM